MKTSIVIPLLGKRLTKKEMHEYALKAYHYGYDGIEPEFSPFWGKESVLNFINDVADMGLQIPVIGTGLICNYGTFSDKNSNRKKRCLNLLKKFIKIASKAEAGIVVSTVKGCINNKKSIEEIKDGMKECILFSKNFDVSLLIEPLNRYETNCINTVKGALKFIEEFDTANVRILVDTFHMNIEEPNIEESIRNSKPYLSHIHVADSNRWAPGYGHLNFESIIKTLKEIGYKGYLSAEILPLPNPSKAAKQTITLLKKIL